MVHNFVFCALFTVQRYNKNCIYASVRGIFLRKKAIYRLFVSIEWLLGACSQIVTLCLQMQGR